MLVKDLMSKDVLTVTPDTSLQEFAGMLKAHKISGIPVVDGDKIVGMVTLTDMMKILGKVNRDRKSAETAPEAESSETSGGEAEKFDIMAEFKKEIINKKVGDIMTTEVISLGENETLDSLVELMSTDYVHTFPIVKGNKIVGIVGKRDLVAAFSV